MRPGGDGSINILFWNTNIPKSNNKKADNINSSLVEMVLENDVDILSLAEYSENIQQLCDTLNASSKKNYVPAPIVGAYRVTAITNENYQVEPIIENNHYAIIKIVMGSKEIIFAMIHNISKLRYSDKAQRVKLRQFHECIVKLENNLKCFNTLAIGDFNANPFEEATVGSDGMHAIPYYKNSKIRESREVLGEVRKMFYNPTWKLFGSRDIPFATYFYNDSGEPVNFYWNAFDQVMIRPSLIDFFDTDKIKIITETTNHPLLAGEKPDKIKYSDHLPLFCSLKEELV